MTHDSLRDRYFALGPHTSEAERQRFLAEVDAHQVEPTTRLQGLSLSSCPSARFKLLRFVEASELDELVRARFARPCADLPELAAAFVDPEEFSYRSFENILGLDRMFAALGRKPATLSKPKRLAKGIARATLKVSAPLQACLDRLDPLDLYVPPFDPGARGGKRFIFHSAALAEALSDALRSALPKSQLAGFVHVNPVFRCNRFEPGDARFAAHVDSPYYDRARHHVSKQTLLIYLSGGRGQALLRFGEGLVIDAIEPMSVFVFEQGLEHEGGPFDAGNKVFLRTELVFEDRKLEHEPGIAERFAKACYLGTQSVFTPELARFAHAAYDQAAAAHWQGPPDSSAREPFVHKQFRGVHFVTNGFDYWFAKSDRLELVDAAALALLDLLNAQIAGTPFRKLCTSELLERPADDQAWIAELLVGLDGPDEPALGRSNKPALFPAPEEPDPYMDFPTSPDFSAQPFPDDWEGTRNPKVIDAYVRAQRYAMRRIFAAPITMLGQEIFVDPERFVVDAKAIHVLSRDRLEPVHFAGAVFFGAEDFVDVDLTFDALVPLVPPIFHRELGSAQGRTIHLCCDLFRNSWMVGQRRERAPIPRVLTGTDVDPDVDPWLSAASAGRDRKQVEAELAAERLDEDDSRWRP